MDKIWLHGVACRSRIGVPIEERRRPQRILLDVGVELDLSGEASRDRLSGTVDYQALELAVRELAESKERLLLEALAAEVAELVLKRDSRVASVHVRVSKKPAVMPKTEQVSIEINRSRKAEAA